MTHERTGPGEVSEADVVFGSLRAAGKVVQLIERLDLSDRRLASSTLHAPTASRGLCNSSGWVRARYYTCQVA